MNNFILIVVLPKTVISGGLNAKCCVKHSKLDCYNFKIDRNKARVEIKNKVL